MRDKTVDLETLASKLDISPTMHKYAVERYEGIAEYLKNNGINASFYPQGSFRTGTVTRPLKGGKEADYDIDVICEMQFIKQNVTPYYVKNIVGNALKKNETYKTKMKPEEDRCWTLQYAEITDGIGFLLDVVPCVGEENQYIIDLISKGAQVKYAQHSVAITEKITEEKYIWIPSNPKGYGEWFDEINERFKQANIYERKQQIFNENRALFGLNATIEDVPDYMVRSSLQRVIQLLKRHRDIYYARIKREDLKPISAIITTLVTKIANEICEYDVNNLLIYVISSLREYSQLLLGQKPSPNKNGEIRNYIQKSDQKWEITNPVNPDDNYADSWTDETARYFFAWIEAVTIDLAQTDTSNETKYITGLMTSFGSEFVNNGLNINRINTPMRISTPTKPWGNW